MYDRNQGQETETHDLAGTEGPMQGDMTDATQPTDAPYQTPVDTEAMGDANKDVPTDEATDGEPVDGEAGDGFIDGGVDSNVDRETDDAGHASDDGTEATSEEPESSPAADEGADDMPVDGEAVTEPEPNPESAIDEDSTDDTEDGTSLGHEVASEDIADSADQQDDLGESEADDESDAVLGQAPEPAEAEAEPATAPAASSETGQASGEGEDSTPQQDSDSDAAAPKDGDATGPADGDSDEAGASTGEGHGERPSRRLPKVVWAVPAGIAVIAMGAVIGIALHGRLPLAIGGMVQEDPTAMSTDGDASPDQPTEQSMEELADYVWHKQEERVREANRLTSAQQAVVDTANEMGAAGESMCLAWVNDVFESAGWEFERVWAASEACDTWCHSTNRNDLKAGMIIAVESTETSPYAGHIGIYIGNGMIRDNETWGGEGVVMTRPLDEWLDMFGKVAEPRWGWAGGYDLTDPDVRPRVIEHDDEDEQVDGED